MLLSGTLSVPRHNPKGTPDGVDEHLASLYLCGLYWDQFRKLFHKFCTEYVLELPIDEQKVYQLQVRT